MTTELAVAVLLIAAACTRAELLSPTASSGAPPDVRAACDLASYRCTQCHSLDPILELHPAGPGDWRAYVGRMRHMPGSLIGADEERPITTCLVYRSFGLDAARGLTW